MASTGPVNMGGTPYKLGINVISKGGYLPARSNSLTCVDAMASNPTR